MLDWIALFCLVGAVLLLAILSVIDLKTRLLPNELVLGFATLGLVFHLTTFSRFIAPMDMAFGALLAFGSLYALRCAANFWYDADTLGLGDVKLMGAAGLWLGPDMVMAAMAIGAGASVLHGLGVAALDARKTGHFDLAGLALPAGPGFAAGIVIVGIFTFRDFPQIF